MEFSNKVVLITGASSGVGAAIAVHFSKLSARLALTARNVDNLKNVADLCHRNSALEPLLITADVTSDEDVERIVRTVQERYGRLDTLVNNAGMLINDKITDTTMVTFDTLMNTNFRSAFNLTRLCIPLLLESEGSVVNISSIIANKVFPGYLSYGITKAAMNYFTKSIAVELGPKKVRVNSINLGYVRTEIFRRAGFGEDDLSDVEKCFVSMLPRAEIIEADDVAKLIAFLASDSAKSMTGGNVNLDNGLLAI